MASGDSYKSLEYNFRVANNTIRRGGGGIVPETCEALYEEFKDEYFKVPNNPDEWREVARGFQERWNFPKCLGAIDGKHVAKKAPGRTVSLFYNYKGFFSVVMMALVDSKYRFLNVDVGSHGSCSDGGLFMHTELKECLENDTLGVPPPEPYPNDDRPMPYCIVGDDAFPRRRWLMKPYPQRLMTKEERISIIVCPGHDALCKMRLEFWHIGRPT
ncbi:Protein ANTAGONIST OF LIKE HETEROCHROMATIN PROTEIN 1 [Holothuria leucospilota]|uniref:Protein ANTAGONIST OF LIKE HETEROCHROMATIN PROTEIN 1 n=1 Tax=Holothuria leucospilota TaxID=206669 RepID=A0A9Q1CDC7_HOLLE|nr:Protein ANTAGONIST OF LIKE HETEROCHROMATIN PROTEIN 1 [Holothuria leucospilota]